MISLLRRLAAATLCRWDIHALGAGVRRVEVDDLRPSTPAFLKRCANCEVHILVAPEPHLEAAALAIARSWRHGGRS